MDEDFYVGIHVPGIQQVFPTQGLRDGYAYLIADATMTSEMSADSEIEAELTADASLGDC